MLSFLDVKLHNFLSHESSVVRLSEPGLTVVVGENRYSAVASSNCSGKSTPFNALIWCLYGQTLTGLRGEDVIRRGSDGVCKVATTISESVDKGWIISREQRGNRCTLRVYKRTDTGTPLATGDQRETQTWIETLLGMDFELFAQCVLLGQDSPIFAASTDAHRKDALERVAGVGDYDQFRVVAKNKLTALCRSRDAVDAERKQHLAAAAASLGIADPTTITPADLAKRADTAVRAAESALAREPELRAAQSELDLQRTEIRQQEEASRRRVNEASGRYNMAVGAMKQWEQNLASLKTVCPTCKRDLDPATLDKSRQSFEQAIAQAASQRDTAAADLKVAQSEADASAAYLAKQSQRLQEASNKVVTELAGLDQHRQQERMLRSAADRLAKAAICDTTLRDLTADQPYLEFWADAWGPKGVKSFVFDGVAMFLNSAVRRFSDVLLGGDIEVKFHTQRQLKGGGVAEDFHITALNSVGSDLYASKSAGERQRVDLCVALALQTLARQRAKTSTQLLVMDEICTNVDAVGEDLVYTLLRMLAKDVPVYLVSHKPGLQGIGDNTVSVVKKNGISTLTQS